MKSRRFNQDIYDTDETQWNTSNYYLLKKNNFKCYYCGIDLTIKSVQREHFIPRSKGGSNSVTSSNIVPSCFRCNMKKHVKTIEQFRKKLFKNSTTKFYFEKRRDGEKIN